MGCTHSTARSADVITIPYDGETRCSKVMALAAACASVRLSSSVVACERLPCDDALLRAAAAGDEARVEAALLAGANPNCKALPSMVFGPPPLLALPPPLGTPFVSCLTGATPLVLAALHGRAAVIPALVLAGAAPDGRSENQVTPLAMACVLGRAAVAVALIDGGASVDETVFGLAPLLLSSACGHPGLVRLLLRRGADASCESHDGLTVADMSECTNAKDAVLRALRNEKLRQAHALWRRSGHGAMAPSELQAEDGHAPADSQNAAP